MTARHLSSDDASTGRSTSAGMPDGAPTGPTASVDEPTMVIGPSDGPTALIAVVPQSPPVFVDPSGRRRSRLRWLAYAVGLVGLLYTGLVAVSFAGGVVDPRTVLPFVDEVEQPQRPRSPQAEAITVTPDPSTVPRAPTATVAPSVAPAAPRSVVPSRSPSRTPSSSGRPARAPATPTPTPRPTVPAAPTPAGSPSSQDPPPSPEETLVGPDDLPADG
ncbi:hypothetical protein [Micromonospora sp. NPDC093244]|uniref:hypothetical protein n=1 Tax=Micromonospora sp. NPDC093244 TaxID=3155071 RepID=UPI003442F8BA